MDLGSSAKRLAGLAAVVQRSQRYTRRRRRDQAIRNLNALSSMSIYIRRVIKLNHGASTDDPRWLRKSDIEQAAVPNGGISAWLRVLGYFLVCTGTLGLQYAFAALYPTLLDTFGEGPTITALIGSLCAGSMEGFAVPSSLVIARLGARRTCLIGCALATVGLLLSAACSSVWQLVLTYGLLTGVGHSLAFFAPIVLMPRWFHTKLARVHAIGNMGGAVTPLVLGQIAPSLVRDYGWRLMCVCRVLRAARSLVTLASHTFRSFAMARCPSHAPVSSTASC